MRGMLGAAWGRAIPMRRATLIALLTAERAQLDCLRLLGAYCLLAGGSTRWAERGGRRPRGVGINWLVVLEAWHNEYSRS